MGNLYEHVPQPAAELSPVHHECERFTEFLLGQPNFSVQHPNVVTHVRAELDLLEDAYAVWSPMIGELITDRPLVSVSKSDPALKSPDTMTLNYGLIKEHPEAPFFTPELLEVLDKALLREGLAAPNVVRPPEFESELSVRALNSAISSGHAA